MDGSQEPRIRVQRSVSVSVTSRSNRRGSSSSSHHQHHSRPRAASSASTLETAAERADGGNHRRHRSLTSSRPPRSLVMDDYGSTTATGRAEAAVAPSPRSSVLPRPKGNEARMRMIVKQQREIQEIRELAEFLRNKSPPPENFMSRPDDAMSARSTSPDPKSRSQLARRWCALKSVLLLRRRKAHKDDQKRRSRRASTVTAATTTKTTTTTTTTLNPNEPSRPRTAQFQLPDSAVAGTTIAGHRHIAISIPVEHSHLGPEVKSQYPIYAPGEDRSAGLFSPPRARADLEAAAQGQQQHTGPEECATVLGPVAERGESGDDASRSPLSSPGYHTPLGVSSSTVPTPTATATTITASPPARVVQVVVRNNTPPADTSGGQTKAPSAEARQRQQQQAEEPQQRAAKAKSKTLSPEAPVTSTSPLSDSYFTAPNSLRSAPTPPSDGGTFGPGRSGVRATILGGRTASIDGLMHGGSSSCGGDHEDDEDDDHVVSKRPEHPRSSGSSGISDATHHQRQSSMASRRSIADSIVTDGTEPVIMTDIQRVRRISSSPSIVHQHQAGAPRHSLPQGLVIPPLRGHDDSGGETPVTAFRMLPSPISSAGGSSHSSGSRQRRLRRVSGDIRNSPPIGEDALPGTPASQRTIRPQRQADDDYYVDAPQGLDRSPLTPFPIETSRDERDRDGRAAERPSSHDGAAAFFSSSGERVGLMPMKAAAGAPELATPPRSRGSVAAATPSMSTSRASGAGAGHRPEFQLQPAPRFARGGGGGGSGTPTRRANSLNFAGRRLVVGGGSPAAVHQRHLLMPTGPSGEQPHPPTPSSGPTPPESPKTAKQTTATAAAAAVTVQDEPLTAVPAPAKQHRRRHSAPVPVPAAAAAAAGVKSGQGSSRHVSAQQQENPKQKEQQGRSEEPEQPADRVSLSRRIERRKKLAAAAAGARQAEVFAAAAAAAQAQTQTHNKKQAEAQHEEAEGHGQGDAQHFYHHHYHHHDSKPSPPRDISLTRLRRASLPRSLSPYSTAGSMRSSSSIARQQRRNHHHHHHHQRDPLSAAAVSIMTPAERRVDEMERRVRLLEQTGEAWLGALVPLIESLGRTLEAQRAHQKIEDYRRRRRMSSASAGGWGHQQPTPGPEAAPPGWQREQRRMSKSERPMTSGGYEAYGGAGAGDAASAHGSVVVDEGDEFVIRRGKPAPLHPDPPIASYFGLAPYPSGERGGEVTETTAAARDLRAARAQRRRSTASTGAGSARSRGTAVLVGDLVEDDVSRRLGLDEGGHLPRHRQLQPNYGWPRHSLQPQPPPSAPSERGSSSVVGPAEAKRQSWSSSVRSQTSHSSRPKTSYGHRRNLSGASAFSAASSGFEYGGGGGSSSNRAEERYGGAAAGMDGFHTLSPLMNELTGDGVSWDFYPKEPVRLEDEIEGDAEAYY